MQLFTLNLVRSYGNLTCQLDPPNDDVMVFIAVVALLHRSKFDLLLLHAAGFDDILTNALSSY